MQNNQDRLEHSNEDEQEVLDNMIGFLVLLQLIVNKTEELELDGYKYGNLKNFLNTSKQRYEAFINKVFKEHKHMSPDDAKLVSGKLLTLQGKIEVILENRYVLTIDERRDRARAILSKSLIKPMVEVALKEMEHNNLFNF